MNTHSNTSYAVCPRKLTAREDTIINPYRELFGPKIPIRAQYWTLAGQVYDKDGYLGRNSEISQITEAGLISIKQYKGIDSDSNIIRKNKEAAPAATFIKGDFVRTLKLESEKTSFNPAIINADFTRMPATSMADSAEILNLLNNVVDRGMLVCNMPANNPHLGDYKGPIDADAILDLLKYNLKCNHVFQNGWKIYPEHYIYGGAGTRSKTKMITFIIYKK